MQTGLAFLPAPLVIGTMSLFFSVKLTIRYGTRRVLLTGLAALAIGLVLLSRAPVDGNYWQHVMPTLVIQGFGMGLAVPAVIMRAMSGAAPEDAGLASGLNSTAQQSGAAVGLAVLATVATSRSNSLLDKGAENISALRDGYSLAFLFSAGFVALGFLATYFILKDAPKTEPAPEVETAQDQQDAGPVQNGAPVQCAVAAEGVMSAAPGSATATAAARFSPTATSAMDQPAGPAAGVSPVPT